MTNRTRVLLVDDHALFRKGLASLLASHPDLQVVAEAGDGLEAIELAGKHELDIILLDIAMPRCTGLEAIPGLQRAAPAARIIMLTASEEDEDLFAAIRAGADGYLVKDLEPEQLFALLEAARRGEVAMTGALAARILLEFRRQRPGGRGARSATSKAGAGRGPGEAQASAAAGCSRGGPETAARTPCELPAGSERIIGEEMTPREIEVLRAVAQGATNKEIGAALGISENTVKNHLRNILEKLHLGNRTQATAYAIRQGWAGDPEND